MEPNQQTYKSYHAPKESSFFIKTIQVFSGLKFKTSLKCWLSLSSSCICVHIPMSKPYWVVVVLDCFVKLWSWHPKEEEGFVVGLSHAFSLFLLDLFAYGDFGIILLSLTMHCLVSPILFFFFNEKIIWTSFRVDSPLMVKASKNFVELEWVSILDLVHIMCFFFFFLPLLTKNTNERKGKP